MHGLMMDFPLTLAAIFRRVEQLFPRRPVVTRRTDRSIHRYTYADFADRTRRFAHALQDLGISPGDRIATLAWNQSEHLEAYFAIPMAGGVLHTLNLRLHPDELAFIVNDANDQVVLVDRTLLPLWEKVAPLTSVKHVVVWGDAGGHSSASQGALLPYESLLGHASPLSDPPDPDERAAAAMCYTTGTTGKPKGVLYSHRALVLHSLASSLSSCLLVGEHDTVMPVVPVV